LEDVTPPPGDGNGDIPEHFIISGTLAAGPSVRDVPPRFKAGGQGAIDDKME